MWSTYPNFIHNIECIFVARKREPDLGQCIGRSVSCRRTGTFKRVPEICFGVFH